MKAGPESARILVCTDNADDAGVILGQLRGDFAQLRASFVAEVAVHDFEEYRPDVLVLGFDTLDKTLRYHRELCQSSLLLPTLPCRTIILCNKNEVRAAFELCKSGQFDDYVLHWPQFYDGSRLAMSVWSACRALRATDPDAPRQAELRVHARQLADLAQTMERGFDEGAQHIAQTRPTGMSGPDPLREWARKMRDDTTSALQATRVLTDKVLNMRRVLLVVEDDEFTSKLIARMLNAELFQIMFAADGSQALSLLRNLRPDVILMDIRLPGLDGLSLTRRLKATPRLADIPVVMMTGDARRETLVSSMEAGAAAFVVKPFTRDSLMAKIEKILPR